MASTTTIYPNTLEGVKAFCKGRKALDLIRSFSTTPIPSAPAKWDDTLGVCLDLEWYNQPPDNPMEIINEGGLVVFPMKKLRSCKNPSDFENLIRNFAVHHLRIVETCHMRNKGKDKFGIPFGDTELNPRFCQTRFVTKSEAQAVLVQFLDNQRCDDGSKRPVIFFGQGLNNDERQLKEQWNLNTAKLDSIVLTIRSLGALASHAGIVAAPDKERGESLPRFVELLRGFQVDTGNIWLHNSSNDAVYETTLFFLVVLFPVLYPGTPCNQFPPNCTIAGRSINDIWTDLAEEKKAILPQTWGTAQFCWYCEKADVHDADACPVKETIECDICAKAPGPENKRFRSKQYRFGHQTSRCTHQFRHYIPPLPAFITDNLDHEEQRAVSRAKASDDVAVGGRILFDKLLAPGYPGRIGDRELDAEDERRAEEDKMLWSLSDADDEEFALDDE
ncbi:hypothetical protein J4E85_002070 [Alternaria conjuncta]|uniref:uncharacterized protein n=1 Tax=Alternaria conjuncta TaxID=181017 RepID=UPI002220951D|nr:uncharacterized protein J4E85_002070 [Alternaria conjuncta]KAI4934214.1 hypothetical protein J4E85_002070 [Alternaria conjuncta]